MTRPLPQLLGLRRGHGLERMCSRLGPVGQRENEREALHTPKVISIIKMALFYCAISLK